MNMNMTDEEKIQWKVDQVMKMHTKKELARIVAMSFIATHWPLNWRQEE